MSKSKGQYLLIDPDDLPTLSTIKEAVKRLRKDADLLTKLPSNREPDPKTLRAAADFLDQLSSAYKNQFPKGAKDDVAESDNSGS